MPAVETNFVGLDELLTAGSSAVSPLSMTAEPRRHCASIPHQLFYGRRNTALRILAVLLTATAVLVTAALLLGEAGLQTAVGLMGFVYLLRHRHHQLASSGS